MKKIIGLLLAALLALSPFTLAEELPVLVTSLGSGVLPVDEHAQGNEYVELLRAEDICIYMARLEGTLSAEEAAKKLLGDVYEGELIAMGENGIDERAVFLTGHNEDTNAADVTVIQREGFTYAFICLCDAELYLDDETAAEYRGQVDFWVSMLDVFDAGAYELQPAGDLMWSYECPFEAASVWQACGLVTECGMATEDGAVQWEERVTERTGGELPEQLFAAADTVDPMLMDFDFALMENDLSSSSGLQRYFCSWTAEQEGAVLTNRALIVPEGGYVYMLRVILTADAPADALAQAENMLRGAELLPFADDTVYSLVEEIRADIFPEAEDFWCTGEADAGGIPAERYLFVDAELMTVGELLLNADENIILVSFLQIPPEDELPPTAAQVYVPLKWDAPSGHWLLGE